MLSLRELLLALTLRDSLDDQRVKRLQDLLQEATHLQEAASKLIEDITDQLQRSIFIHDDRGGNAAGRWRSERRQKPRS